MNFGKTLFLAGGPLNSFFEKGARSRKVFNTSLIDKTNRFFGGISNFLSGKQVHVSDKREYSSSWVASL